MLPCLAPYLPRLLIPYRPSSVLKSSSFSDLLQVPQTNFIFGSLSFRAAAPTIWNSFHDSIRLSDRLLHLTIFSSTLKHIFQTALIHLAAKSAPPIYLCDHWHFINVSLTYLLTYLLLHLFDAQWPISRMFCAALYLRKQRRISMSEIHQVSTLYQRRAQSHSRSWTRPPLMSNFK